jgi:hypothetical protein
MKRFFSFVCVSFFLLIVQMPVADTVTVATLDGLLNAIDTVSPGSEVVLEDGTYTADQDLSITRVNGGAEQWITVRAQTIGGSEIRGQGHFKIKRSSFLHINGFVFSQAAESYCLSVGDSTYDIRVSDCVFQPQENGDKSYWVYLSGTPAPTRIRIDHNRFAAKNDEGCFIVIYGPDEDVAKAVTIDWNHFMGHNFEGSNGGEAIRFGDSYRQNYISDGLIAHNLFENCKGDVEVISVKTTRLTVQQNTLRGCRGSIVLRHGDSCVVEGNYILNGNGGIRLYGDNHIIVGNYIGYCNDRKADGSQSDALGALCIGGGSTEDMIHENQYDQVSQALVAYNTLAYNTGVNLHVGVFGSSSYPPTQLTIVNNVIVTDRAVAVLYDKSPTNSYWGSNLIGGTADPGDLPDSGAVFQDPQWTEVDSVFQMVSGSPAIDASEAVDGLTWYSYDIEGQPRTNNDIGCDEVAAGSALYGPLSAEDVGPGTTEPTLSAQRSPSFGSGLRLTTRPNPFNPLVTIRLHGQGLGEREQSSKLNIFDIQGRNVYSVTGDIRSILSGVTWNASGFASNRYLVRVNSGKLLFSQWMILEK